MPDSVETWEVIVEPPAARVIWDGVIHSLLATVYFLVLSSLAVGIDLGLHWFESLCWVEKYELSSFIRWEVELMAYALAAIDFVLFVNMLIRHGVESVVEWILELRRGN